MQNKLKKLTTYIFFLYIFLLPFSTIYILRELFIGGEKFQWGTIGIMASQILFLAYFLLRVIWDRKGIKRLFQSKFIYIFPILFLQIFFVPDKLLFVQSFLWFLQGFLTYRIIDSDEYSKGKIIHIFLASSAIQSAIGLFQIIFQKSINSAILGMSYLPVSEAGSFVIAVGDERFLRASGAFSHPNIFGFFIAISLALLFFQIKLKKKYWQFLLAFLFILALFFSFSRAAWLGFAVFASVFFFYYKLWKEKFWKYFYAGTLILSLGIAFLFDPFTLERFGFGDAPNRVENPSLHYRVSGYNEFFSLFEENLWFGVGVGQYSGALIEAFPDRSVYSYQPVHNSFFLLLAELGILGFLLLIFFLKQKKYSKQMIFFLAFLPIIFFDHYLFSSYIGIMSFALFIPLTKNQL